MAIFHSYVSLPEGKLSCRLQTVSVLGVVQNLIPPEMEWQQPDQAYGYEVCVKLSCRKKRDGSIIGAIYPGWWYTYPSEKYEFVSWDDDIPN